MGTGVDPRITILGMRSLGLRGRCIMHPASGDSRFSRRPCRVGAVGTEEEGCMYFVGLGSGGP